MQLDKFTTVEQLATAIKTYLGWQLGWEMTLAADVAIAETSCTVKSKVLGMAADLGWIVIDPNNTECEIRKITGITNLTLSWSGGLTYAHDANDPVYFIHKPIAEATWFGYNPDGSTDSTTSLTRAFAQVDHVRIPEGIGVISTVAIGTNQRLSGTGTGSSILKVTGSGTALTVSGQYATLENFSIHSVTANERNWDGISLAGARHTVRNINIFDADDGINMPDAVYHCKISDIYMYNIGTYGFHLGATSFASNNTIDFKQLIGNSTPGGSIGIYVETGSVNRFQGGQIDHFETAIKTDTPENTFTGIWQENNTTAYNGTSGRNYINSRLGGDPITLSGTASLVTHGGGFSEWVDYSSVRPSTYDLELLYLFNTGTGTTIVDHSGNSRDGTLSGSSNSWVEGLFDTALQIGSGGKVDIPTATLDPSDVWTIALLWKPVTLDTYNDELFIIKDSSDFMQLMTDDNVTYYKWRFYDGDTTDKTLNSMRQTGRWCWAAHTYDPDTGVMTNLDPVRDEQTFTEANLISSISDIELHVAGTHTANYQLLALWQRALSEEEMRQFINGSHWLAWMYRFNI